MDKKANNTWKDVLDYIQERINSQSFNTWFRGSCGVELKEDVLLVEFPNVFQIDWIEEHYYNILVDAFHQLNGNKLMLAFKALKQQ